MDVGKIPLSASALKVCSVGSSRRSVSCTRDGSLWAAWETIDSAAAASGEAGSGLGWRGIALPLASGAAAGEEHLHRRPQPDFLDEQSERRAEEHASRMASLIGCTCTLLRKRAAARARCCASELLRERAAAAALILRRPRRYGGHAAAAAVLPWWLRCLEVVLLRQLLRRSYCCFGCIGGRVRLRRLQGVTARQRSPCSCGCRAAAAAAQLRPVLQWSSQLFLRV
mmetsp:Transcript_90877/g.272917  ORF Transcript_90877/g.272917 Transcript_90877/m.272917 type:complete len:226 (-) Transcript_90877:11-688(-)